MSLEYLLSAKEMEQVLLQGHDVRYEYFVKRVADWGMVWSLKGAGGWVMSADSKGREAAPFWPFTAYAERCANERWESAVAKSIEIDDFLSKWLPGLDRDNRLVVVFPNIQKQAALVEPLLLKEAIEAEIERLE